MEEIVIMIHSLTVLVTVGSRGASVTEGFVAHFDPMLRPEVVPAYLAKMLRDRFWPAWMVASYVCNHQGYTDDYPSSIVNYWPGVQTASKINWS